MWRVEAPADFYADKSTATGWMADCKECVKEKARLRYIQKVNAIKSDRVVQALTS